MIIKKLWRKIKNSNHKDCEFTEIKEYLGYFLFGFIPIYLIELDSYTNVKDDKGEDSISWGINKRYKYLLTGIKI